MIEEATVDGAPAIHPELEEHLLEAQEVTRQQLDVPGPLVKRLGTPPLRPGIDPIPPYQEAYGLVRNEDGTIRFDEGIARLAAYRPELCDPGACAPLGVLEQLLHRGEDRLAPVARDALRIAIATERSGLEFYSRAARLTLNGSCIRGRSR